MVPKTILRLFQSAHSDLEAALPRQITLHEHQYLSQSYPDLVPMVQEFLRAAVEKLGYLAQPRKACFAIAGPVVNSSSNLTNLAWRLNTTCLAQVLSIEKVSLINDFAAVSYGVLSLPPNKLHTLQVGRPDPNAVIAIIGAGTGLEQGFLTPRSEGVKGATECIRAKRDMLTLPLAQP